MNANPDPDATLTPKQVTAAARWLSTWRRVDAGDPAELRYFTLTLRADGAAIARAHWREGEDDGITTSYFDPFGDLLAPGETVAA